MTHQELIQTIRQQTRELFSKNTKEMGLWIIQFDGVSGIIKCNSQEKEHIRELLESLKMIGSKPVAITTHGTSGTIRGLTNRTQKRPQESP